MTNQTRKADIDIIVDYRWSGRMDLPERYRDGFERAFAAGADVAFAIEDDDYYPPDYIERMVTEWELKGKPVLFGIEETTYYHIGRREYKQMHHTGRSSMFTTMVTPEIMKHDFADSVWLDIHLWGLDVSKGFAVQAPKALGIKHGEGVCGGAGHGKQFNYPYKDSDHKFLKSITNDEFYLTY